MKCGNHIGFEQTTQLAQLHLLERAGERVAGTVDQHIDTAVLGVDLLDESSDRSLVGDVESAGV